MKLAYAGSQGPFTPQDKPQFTVTVTNNGPGDAPGVEVRVDLPSKLRYRSSTITGFGNARTQPVDARVGSAQPAWGFWNLAAPSSGSKLCESCVVITFTTDVAAPPGNYSITAHAQGDNTSGEVSSDALKLTVNGSPKLDVSTRVQAGTLFAGNTATYQVTVTNTGTGAAENVTLLITLPPMMTFQKTSATSGNASRNNPIDPIKGSVEVYYSAWTIPAGSSGGPGILNVAFVTQVSAGPPGGTYTCTVQVTDNQNDMVTLTNAAPVNVVGSTPSPSAKASPTPTHKP